MSSRTDDEMTKKEVIARLQQQSRLMGQESRIAVETVLDCIKGSLSAGENVSLVGSGTFSVRNRRARNGRNPRTGEAISVPAKSAVLFRPGKAFRNKVNECESLSEPPTSPGDS